MQSKFMKADTTYDSEYDILDIDVVCDYKYETSLELEKGVILDFDENNVPVSLEILDASKIFNVKDKSLFNNPKKVDMFIEITEEVIKVKVEIKFDFQRKMSSLKSIVLNTIKAPVMQTELATS